MYIKMDVGDSLVLMPNGMQLIQVSGNSPHEEAHGEAGLEYDGEQEFLQ